MVFNTSFFPFISLFSNFMGYWAPIFWITKKLENVSIEFICIIIHHHQPHRSPQSIEKKQNIQLFNRSLSMLLIYSVLAATHFGYFIQAGPAEQEIAAKMWQLQAPEQALAIQNKMFRPVAVNANNGVLFTETGEKNFLKLVSPTLTKITDRIGEATMAIWMRDFTLDELTQYYEFIQGPLAGKVAAMQQELGTIGKGVAATMQDDFQALGMKIAEAGELGKFNEERQLLVSREAVADEDQGDKQEL